MVGKEPDIGPTARTVAKNVEQLRQDADLNYTELSERLQAVAGWSINAVGIRRIESGERRVTPDDLVALALALGVAPVTLLMPSIRTAGADDAVEVTGVADTIAADRAWNFLTARDTLERGDMDVLLAFYQRAWPQWTHEGAAEQYRAAMAKLQDKFLGDVFGGRDGND